MSDDLVKRLYATVARLGVRDAGDYSVTVNGGDIMSALSTLEFHAAEITRLRAALATARQDALAEIKQDTDELIEQGRQDGMEQAAKIALAMSISSPSVIAAAIRAAAKEGKP